MSTDTALIEKREELKRRLAAGEYKTLVDICLAWFERLVRKIIPQSKPLAIWQTTVILIFVLNLIGSVAIYVAGDWISFIRIVELLRLGYGLGFLFAISLSILAMANPIVVNQYVSRIFAFWCNNILDATESVASLEEFEDWLNKVCNWRLHLLVTILVAILLVLYEVPLISAQFGVFIGFGLMFSAIITNIIGWNFLYLFLLVILLSARIRRYEIKLFAADPGSSELISRLSSELGFIVYYVAVYAAFLTLGTSWSGFLPSVGIVLVLVLWVPLIALFTLNHASLSSIIQRAKWKTLNEAQAKVEKLRVSKNFGNQETMDAIKRLMDYHDRVKATRDSALDFRAYLSFFNSLLLPLLAFILGNLDLVFKLFGRNP